MNDSDDEVRERAFIYFKAFNDEGAWSIVFSPKTVNIENLQSIIQAQREFLLKSRDIVGDIKNLLNDPSVLEMITKKEVPKLKPEKKFIQESKKEEEKIATPDDVFSDYKTTSFYKKFGLPRHCTLFQRLNDQYAEYVVSLRKIVYEDVVILDFEITNTMDDFNLKKVSLDITEVSNLEAFDIKKTEIIEIDTLKSKDTRHLYLQLIKKEKYSHCSFVAVFKYTVQEKDAKGNVFQEYKDSFKVQKKVDVKISDYFMRNPQVFLNNFG